jgi:hypothetical protein
MAGLSITLKLISIYSYGAGKYFQENKNYFKNIIG